MRFPLLIPFLDLVDPLACYYLCTCVADDKLGLSSSIATDATPTVATAAAAIGPGIWVVVVGTCSATT